MVKLSSYSNGYDNMPVRLTPWEFWTEEEKSHVIHEAYRGHYLESPEVKKYLDISKKHMYTQFLVPALAGVGYFGLLKDTVFKGLFRRSPTHGFVGIHPLIKVELRSSPPLPCTGLMKALFTMQKSKLKKKCCKLFIRKSEFP